MVDIASEKGVTLTVDEVKGFLKQMDVEEEFDDIQLELYCHSSTVTKNQQEASFPACVRCASGTRSDESYAQLNAEKGVDFGAFKYHLTR